MESTTQAQSGGFFQKYPKAIPPFHAILGLVIAGFGFYSKHQILEAEINGGTITLPRFMFPIYDAIGANGVLGIFILIGLYFLYQAVIGWKKLSQNS